MSSETMLPLRDLSWSMLMAWVYVDVQELCRKDPSLYLIQHSRERKAGPAPHLGNRMELTLVAETLLSWESWPHHSSAGQYHGQKTYALHLLAHLAHCSLRVGAH